jgi:lipopolysaccharide/colanic/teichoic acid biosynthesis glycosyltransferase
MAKRLIDILLSVLVLAIASPLLAGTMLLIWSGDRHSPFYRGARVGRGNGDFPMLKLRTMAIDAEYRGGTSTAGSDSRITALGRRLRRWKLDELPQFWNVLRGEMSIVGPRPNTRKGGVERYTPEEMRLLTVRPGITDLSSIVFSDEGDILDGAVDPDVLYDAVIRPWKSRLGLLYVDRRSLIMDIRIMWLTLVAIAAKPAALRGVDKILAKWGASDELRQICRRRTPLPRAEPPGLAA